MFKKIFILLFIILNSCWLVPSPNYYNIYQNVKVFDLNKLVNEDLIRGVISATLFSLKAEYKYIDNVNIEIIHAPICIKGEKEMSIADGYTEIIITGDIWIVVSTMNGCFDSIAHEIGHVIQMRRDSVIDKNHSDKAFWDTVLFTEQWIRKTYCADTYKLMPIKEAIKSCE